MKTPTSRSVRIGMRLRGKTSMRRLLRSTPKERVTIRSPKILATLRLTKKE